MATLWEHRRWVLENQEQATSSGTTIPVSKAFSALSTVRQAILKNAVSESSSPIVQESPFTMAIDMESNVDYGTQIGGETKLYFPIQFSTTDGNEGAMEKPSLKNRVLRYKSQLVEANESWPDMAHTLSSLEKLCNTVHQVLVHRSTDDATSSMRLACGSGDIWARTEIPGSANWEGGGFRANFEIYEHSAVKKRMKVGQSTGKAITFRAIGNVREAPTEGSDV
jgi:hypothetical protein